MRVFKFPALAAWKIKGVAGVQQRRPVPLWDQPELFCQPHTCGRTHCCICLSFRFPHEPSPFLLLSVNTEHPKWLNLLPGLGAVPAPRGAAQAGGPQLIQLPKGTAAWVSAGIKQLLSLSPPHLPWIDSINCQLVDILMRIMSCGIPFDFDMPQFVNT